jgi:hypothetical protein
MTMGSSKPAGRRKFSRPLVPQADRRYDVAGGWIGRRYRLLDDAGGLVAEADGVGWLAWTLEISGETGGVCHTFPCR